MAHNSGTPTHTRRTILKVGGTLALAGFTASGSAIAQTDLPLEIEQNAEDEYVVIRNVGDEEVDISNYQINFEAGEDSNEDQIKQLPSDVVIGPGEEIIVPTGALEVEGDNVVQLTDPYDIERLNNEDPDVVALLDPDDNVVVSTDGTGGGGDGDGDGGDDNGDDGGDGDGDDGDGDDGDDGDGDGDGGDDDTGDDSDDGTGDDSDDSSGDDDSGDSDDSDEDTKDDSDEDTSAGTASDDGDSDDSDDSDDDCPKR